MSEPTDEEVQDATQEAGWWSRMFGSARVPAKAKQAIDLLTAEVDRLRGLEEEQNAKLEEQNAKLEELQRQLAEAQADATQARAEASESAAAANESAAATAAQGRELREKWAHDIAAAKRRWIGERRDLVAREKKASQEVSALRDANLKLEQQVDGILEERRLQTSAVDEISKELALAQAKLTDSETRRGAAATAATEARQRARVLASVVQQSVGALSELGVFFGAGHALALRSRSTLQPVRRAVAQASLDPADIMDTVRKYAPSLLRSNGAPDTHLGTEAVLAILIEEGCPDLAPSGGQKTLRTTQEKTKET